MSSSWMRLLRRTAWDWMLGLFGLAVAFRVWANDAWPWVHAAFAVTAAGVAVGLATRRRSGELAMAWRCPRLDQLGLRVGSRDAPWEVLEATESALQALDGQGAGFREFFPGARRSLVQSAWRAVEAHRLAVRARAALAGAPEGDARRRLEEQELRATRELATLTGALKELEAQLVSSTAPLPSVADPLPALRRMGLESEALGEAVEELRARPESHVVRVGG